MRPLSLDALHSPPGALLGDGAIGTLLLQQGLPPGAAPELWNLQRPEAVRMLHSAYAAAGAAWIGTNTFGGTQPRLEASGLGGREAEVNVRAVRWAREGAPELPVLGCMGPTGDSDPRAWDAGFGTQAELLAGAGVDGFLVETIVNLREGAAAVRAAAAAGGGPVLASFTPGPDGRLLDGAAPERAAEALVRAGASVVGVNCGAGPDSLLDPARRLVAAGAAPVMAAPSAGLPREAGPSRSYPVTPDAFARAAIQYRESGIRLIAGCCGTTPAHIRAAALALGMTRLES